jgi:hypothetical protein
MPSHLLGRCWRKADIKESEWLAELLHHGLLRGSFVPPTLVPRLARPEPESMPCAGAAVPHDVAAEGGTQKPSLDTRSGECHAADVAVLDSRQARCAALRHMPEPAGSL